MSPEVLAPSSTGFDGFAVDVWACGIVLFMCVIAPFLPWRSTRPPVPLDVLLV